MLKESLERSIRARIMSENLGPCLKTDLVKCARSASKREPENLDPIGKEGGEPDESICTLRAGAWLPRLGKILGV